MKIALSVSEKEKAKGASSPYFRALVAAGAQPAELALVSASETPEPLNAEYDGVLFTGGEDVDPSFYNEGRKNETVHVDHARDAFEMKLLDRALNRRLPILGICRGIQMINVKFGGSLYQDVKSDADIGTEHKQRGNRSETTHSITVTEPESILGQAVQGSCRVNSLHHQAIKRVGRGLKVTAYAEDGLVEAVEAADAYPFLMAVQWHPEEISNLPEQKRILQKFLECCRKTAEEERKSASATS